MIEFIDDILSIIMIITFFVMSYRLLKIKKAVEKIANPKNIKEFRCTNEKCNKLFDVDITPHMGLEGAVYERMNCPFCNKLYSIDETKSFIKEVQELPEINIY